jgi:DNA-binding NarL/FixJ family response regulator
MAMPDAPSSIAVVVIEDDHRTRARLCEAIEAQDGMTLAASFDQVRPAIAWLQKNSPHVLLTDLGLPDGSGIDVIKACVALHPACDVMVITMFGDEKNVLSSIEAGAAGYVLKDADRLDVVRAIQDLRAGGSPMSPLIARKLLKRVQQQDVVAASPKKSLKPVLTKREADTLDLIARGYTYDEVARLLGLSVSTVQTHIKGIYGKLAVTSRGEAVFEAHKLGLLQADLLTPARA